MYVPDDKPADAQAWLDRAYDSVNKPWLSAATRAEILRNAGTAVANTPEARRQRLYVLQALILGGPDGQVM